MAVNKVVYGGNVLVDLTGDTVESSKLLLNETATNRAGTKIVGSAVFQNWDMGYINGTVSSLPYDADNGSY